MQSSRPTSCRTAERTTHDLERLRASRARLLRRRRRRRRRLPGRGLRPSADRHQIREADGKVKDTDTGLPIQGATVAFGGHASGFADDIVGVTNGDGVYDVKKIAVGSYPKVWAGGPGYETVVHD